MKISSQSIEQDRSYGLPCPRIFWRDLPYQFCSIWSASITLSSNKTLFCCELTHVTYSKNNWNAGRRSKMNQQEAKPHEALNSAWLFGNTSCMHSAHPSINGILYVPKASLLGWNSHGANGKTTQCQQKSAIDWGQFHVFSECFR